MKILRHNGQKVLEAPIDFDVTYRTSGKNETSLLLELFTVDHGTQYMMLFDIADMANLSQILTAYQHAPDEER